MVKELLTDIVIRSTKPTANVVVLWFRLLTKQILKKWFHIHSGGRVSINVAYLDMAAFRRLSKAEFKEVKNLPAGRWMLVLIWLTKATPLDKVLVKVTCWNYIEYCIQSCYVKHIGEIIDHEKSNYLSTRI